MAGRDRQSRKVSSWGSTLRSGHSDHARGLAEMTAAWSRALGANQASFGGIARAVGPPQYYEKKPVTPAAAPSQSRAAWDL
jgi:hypothetical protein